MLDAIRSVIVPAGIASAEYDSFGMIASRAAGDGHGLIRS
jgi:hypothetical protein